MTSASVAGRQVDTESNLLAGASLHSSTYVTEKPPREDPHSLANESHSMVVLPMEETPVNRDDPFDEGEVWRA